MFKVYESIGAAVLNVSAIKRFKINIDLNLLPEFNIQTIGKISLLNYRSCFICYNKCNILAIYLDNLGYYSRSSCVEHSHNLTTASYFERLATENEINEINLLKVLKR